MNINKVYQCGLEMIHEALNPKNNKTAFFGSNTHSVLNHCSISFDIKSINMIELLYLNRMATRIDVINEFVVNPFTGQYDTKINKVCQKFISLYEQINSDVDVDNFNMAKNILPAGCLVYDVLVTFEGTAIMTIVGSMLQKMFTQVNGENRTVLTEFPSHSILSEILANLFFNNFYSFMANSMDSIDIVSDYLLFNKYYGNITNDDKVILSHVNSPTGQINFIDNSEEGLYSQIANVVKYIKRKSISNHNPSVDMYLTLESTFNTFIDLSMNTKYVMDHQDLKIMLSESSVNLPQDILTKYSTRISESVNELLELREELLNESSKKFQRFMLILLGQPIKYTIKTPVFSDVCINTDTLEMKQLNQRIINYREELNKFL